jgi:two-component system, cell cycle response regulator DivK
VTNMARLSSAAPATPWSVLLADYHDDTRALYGEYLRRQGCLVEEAIDGREALAKAIARRHDVVVSAARLPGIDGYQLCQLLRRDSATSATRVIMVTGDALAADVERARAAGADATLVKPCLPETLLAEMQRLLELDRTRSMTLSAAPDTAHDTGIPVDEHARPRRPILSRIHRRGETSTPPLAPPNLRCPVCDKELTYHHSNIGGVSARHPEQWDYFECSTQCGTFEYRQRTRKIRRVGNGN